MDSNENTLPKKLIYKYFSSLVNCFFKILPIKENGEESLTKYVESLRDEMMGARNLMILDAIDCDARYLTLLAILQNLIDDPNYSVKKTKRDVFRAINICNSLKDQYGKDE